MIVPLHSPEPDLITAVVDDGAPGGSWEMKQNVPVPVRSARTDPPGLPTWPPAKTFAREGPSGCESQQGLHENPRVMCAIDDGGLSWFASMGADFIIAPDGSFVGERKPKP